jgi:DNA-binding transcriptional MerR regulator
MAAETSRSTVPKRELTLEDLVATAARLLRRLDVRPGDGRVSQAPDARGVRYYQGIGVLDRPLRRDGRRAVYGFRHLLQLLAVKRFQQEGHPLHLIQQSLAGCPTAVLERALATVLSGLALSPEPAMSPATAPVESEPQPSKAAPAPEPGSAPLVAARLAPGVTITIDPAVVSDPGAVIARVGGILAHIDKEH